MRSQRRENSSIPSLLPTAWKYLKCSLKSWGKETAFCSPGVLFSFADCQSILVKGWRQGAYSVCVCRRRGKHTSLQALPEHRRQLRTIAGLKTENQMSSLDSTYMAQNISAYPTDITSIECHLHCRHSSRSSTTSCIIPSHTAKTLWDTSTEEYLAAVLATIPLAAHTWHPMWESARHTGGGWIILHVHLTAHL